MSVSNDSTLAGTVDDSTALLSSTFLDFCVKVRTDDTSVLPEPGKPFKIRHLSEKEDMELADALLENNSVVYLELETKKVYEKLCRGIGQVRAYQQALATHSLGRRFGWRMAAA
jgi:hypothetical protein